MICEQCGAWVDPGAGTCGRCGESTRFRIPVGVASLRAGDPDTLRAIAAGGGPTLGGDDLHIYCPLCVCTMSQDACTPNKRTEACIDFGCLCHLDD